MDLDNLTQSLFEAEERLFQAMRTNDLETLDELLHEDLQFMIPSGAVMSKSEDLESHRTRTMVFEDLTYKRLSYAVIGNTGVVTAEQYILGNYAGHPIDANYRYQRTWLHEQGRWSVIAGSGVEWKNA